jgi:hypothetical protein
VKFDKRQENSDQQHLNFRAMQQFISSHTYSFYRFNHKPEKKFKGGGSFEKKIGQPDRGKGSDLQENRSYGPACLLIILTGGWGLASPIMEGNDLRKNLPGPAGMLLIFFT